MHFAFWTAIKDNIGADSIADSIDRRARNVRGMLLDGWGFDADSASVLKAMAATTCTHASTKNSRIHLFIVPKGDSKGVWYFGFWLLLSTKK